MAYRPPGAIFAEALTSRYGAIPVHFLNEPGTRNAVSAEKANKRIAFWENHPDAPRGASRGNQRMSHARANWIIQHLGVEFDTPWTTDSLVVDVTGEGLPLERARNCMLLVAEYLPRAEDLTGKKPLTREEYIGAGGVTDLVAGAPDLDDETAALRRALVEERDRLAEAKRKADKEEARRLKEERRLKAQAELAAAAERKAKEKKREAFKQAVRERVDKAGW